MHIRMHKRPRTTFFTVLLVVAAMAAFTFISAGSAYAMSSTRVQITNRCPIEGAQVLTSFKKGNEVSGSGVMVGDEGINEDEALVVFATNNSFSKLIKANIGSRSFEFTAKQAGQLVACYTLINTDDEGEFVLPDFATTHPASVTFHVSRD